MALALFGIAWYVTSQTDLAWWLGSAATMPLFVLLLWRAGPPKDDSGSSGGIDGGPWGPP